MPDGKPVSTFPGIAQKESAPFPGRFQFLSETIR
jgi:hypothetical protein